MRPSRTLVLRLAVTALIAVPLGLSTASATPYAGQYDYLTGRVQLRGADGATWRLALVATRSGALESRPEQRLYVDLDRGVAGSCTPAGRWSRALTPGEISITDDVTTGVLKTRLLGVPLQVSLAGRSGPLDQVGLYFDSLRLTVGSVDQTGAAPGAGRERGATGRLRLGAASCPAEEALLGQELVVDTVGDDVRDRRTNVPDRAPRGLFGRGLRCLPYAAPDSTS